MRFASTVVLFVIGVVLFSPLALAAPITATPDKATYNPGDILVVSGTATPSSTVTVKVNNPSSAVVGLGQGNTDAAGAYSITVMTWPATAGGNTPFGTYTIIATDAANNDAAQATVEFAQTTTTTTTTNTSAVTTVTTTVTSTTTSRTTLTTTSTTTSTATVTSRTTSTTTSTTTRTSTATSVSTQTRTVTSTSTATTTSVRTTTSMSTVTSMAPPSTTTVTEEVPVGMPAEVTYAAVAVAVVAIIAAAFLVTRKRA